MLTSPTPGSTLTGSSATFTWSAGTGVTKYEFRLGTTGPGSSNVYNSAEATTTALTTGLVSNIPTNGVTLYARLYSLINGAWQYNDYTYTEFGTPVPAALTSPTPGSTLTGSSATFTWSAGMGVTRYEFRLGTTGPGSSNVYNSARRPQPPSPPAWSAIYPPPAQSSMRGSTRRSTEPGNTTTTPTRSRALRFRRH